MGAGTVGVRPEHSDADMHCRIRVKGHLDLSDVHVNGAGGPGARRSIHMDITQADFMSETVCKGFSRGTSTCSWLAKGVRCSGKPPEHETDHGEIDPGFFA